MALFSTRDVQPLGSNCADRQDFRAGSVQECADHTNGPHNRPVCAHSRMPIDVMVAGSAMSLLQASHAASMISS
jgi:hypothetical protein